MENYEKELSQIQGLLKANPKGMTVTDISRELGVNRNSVAKYLDVLQISGQVEMRTVGPAKVYFPAHRVPISAMLNFSSDAILVLNHQFSILRMNKQCQELIPIAKVGMPIADMPFEPFAGHEFQAALHAAFEGQERKTECAVKEDGSEHYYFIRAVPTLFDEGGRGVTVIIEDITERRQAMEEIRAQEMKLRIITSSIPAAVWATDTNLRIQSLYGSALKHLGWDKERMIGKTLYDLLEAGRSQEPILAHRKTLQGEPSSYVRELRGRIYSVKIEPLRNRRGKIVGCVATAFDVTDEHRARERLEHSARHYKALDEISSALARAGIDLHETFRIITQSVAREIGDTCTMRVLSPDKHWLDLVAVHHCDPGLLEIFREVHPPRRRVGEQGLSAHAVRTGEPVLLPVVPAEKVFSLVPEKYRHIERLGRYSLLVVPLRVSGEVIGKLTLTRDHPGNPYTADDKVFLQALADRASFAIERKQAEELLRRSKDELSVILDNIADGIVAQDVTGRPVFMNDAVVRMLGFNTVGEVLAMQPELFAKQVQILDEEGHRLAIEQLPGRLVLAGQEQAEQIVRIRLADGSERLLQVKARPVRDGNGDLVLAVSIARDVTGERETQQRILESERRYRTLVEMLPDGVCTIDLDMTLTFASPRMRLMLGYGSGDALAGADLRSLIVPEDASRFEQEFERLLQTGGGAHARYTLIRKDGSTMAVEAKFSLLHDAGGRPCGVVIVLHEVAEG